MERFDIVILTNTKHDKLLGIMYIPGLGIPITVHKREAYVQEFIETKDEHEQMCEVEYMDQLYPRSSVGCPVDEVYWDLLAKEFAKKYLRHSEF